MRPLNYAMLKYFTTVEEASVDDVMNDLEADYSAFTAFKRDKMQEALMTAEKNGLIGESRVDLDDNGELRVFYSANAEQRDTINSYIK
ncbi:DNA-binding PadR family transcriptional regulator [Olsenella profusa DSM 13989]|uniref:Uncharacterized protein n=1 Tax=Olsenella profusa F0195 TaxID=1125712 RepID=U2TKZ0_9ACTN|nr:hypothetical protein [Olsenella profusa]ERL06828.1 hypothetical protein HMPREF1316_0477 [Olsenella profusa F0195]MDP9858506.1 DNA-binding PadR family transcriptional regulator [Olsenella profusa DSM 13989]